MTKTNIAPLLGLIAVLSVAAPGSARADFPSQGLYVGLFGGGNLVLREWDFGPSGGTAVLDHQHGGLAGLRLGFHVISRLSIELEAAYLPVNAGGVLNHALAYDLNLLFHILKGNWTPTLSAGVGGYTNLAGTAIGSDTDPRFHVGLGLRGLIHPRVAFRLDVRDVIADGLAPGGSNNLELTAGFDFFLWRTWGAAAAASDRDKDTVADRKDACPDTFGLVKLRGCPDSDGDGIADKDDLCPDAPGTSALKGCPDADGDGVGDAEDRCKDTPAGPQPDRAKLGCPSDRDGDGVSDVDDVCADVPKGKRPDKKRSGCPADRDGDGVYDEDDACPAIPGVATSDEGTTGCPPDKDYDSIGDAADACPDKAGAPNPDPKKNGCPGLVEVKRGKIVILQKVFFDTGKDVIKQKSFALLDAVAYAISQLPAENRVAVEGHTDNKGVAAKNLDLSQRRAASVVKYLAGKGVDAGRMDAKGFGQDKPIADNKTAKGREENRRVEFNIVNPDDTSTP